MKKEEINSKLRRLVKEKISITEDDKRFVSKVYNAISDVLGQNNTLQVGSYARFTSIKPLHDLDVLYIVGEWKEDEHSPNSLLEEVKNKLEKNFINPTKYKYEINKQSHSITISFLENNKEVFAVDVVPAYIFSKNEFNDDIYMVPEILLKKHQKRPEIYKNVSLGIKKKIDWIHTDPRGYIKIAQDLNNYNSDFRKSVKFLKAWKNLYKDDFKLKSFHIEQIITNYFLKNKNNTIFDAIFYFFTNLENIISKPQILDRANSDKYIDDYLEKLSAEEKEKILQAKDCILYKFESIEDKFDSILERCFLKRNSESEQFLFDFNIPIFVDKKLSFKIDGFIKPKNGFRSGGLSSFNSFVEKNREIEFRIVKDIEKDYTLWKVQNDPTSPDVPKEQVRGEITENRTLNFPEKTAYKGRHYVDCYVIKNGNCIAKSRIYVIIK